MATPESKALDAYNVAQLANEIRVRLDVIEHEANLIGGLLDDLLVYAPQADDDD